MHHTQNLKHCINKIKIIVSAYSRGWRNVGEDPKVSRPPCFSRDLASALRPEIMGFPSRGGGSGRGSSERRERQKHVG